MHRSGDARGWTPSSPRSLSGATALLARVCPTEKSTEEARGMTAPRDRGADCRPSSPRDREVQGHGARGGGDVALAGEREDAGARRERGVAVGERDRVRDVRAEEVLARVGENGLGACGHPDLGGIDRGGLAGGGVGRGGDSNRDSTHPRRGRGDRVATAGGRRPADSPAAPAEPTGAFESHPAGQRLDDGHGAAGPGSGIDHAEGVRERSGPGHRVGRVREGEREVGVEHPGAGGEACHTPAERLDRVARFTSALIALRARNEDRGSG